MTIDMNVTLSWTTATFKRDKWSAYAVCSELPAGKSVVDSLAGAAANDGCCSLHVCKRCRYSDSLCSFATDCATLARSIYEAAFPTKRPYLYVSSSEIEHTPLQLKLAAKWGYSDFKAWISQEESPSSTRLMHVREGLFRFYWLLPIKSDEQWILANRYEWKDDNGPLAILFLDESVGANLNDYANRILTALTTGNDPRYHREIDWEALCKWLPDPNDAVMRLHGRFDDPEAAAQLLGKCSMIETLAEVVARDFPHLL